MRRRRKTRNPLGVSLFPFLAVLICTLGVLIVLLVLAVRSADVRASREQSQQQEKYEQQQRELDDLNSQHEMRTVQIEGLNSVRPEAIKRLAGAREHRGHLEQEIRRLKQDARALGESLLKMQHEVPAEIDVEQIDERIDALNQQIIVSQQELAEKRADSQKTGPVKYSIVPHAGSGGTFRRPIFVECTADELTIHPLGIRLKKSEFAPPLQSGNMLDSALLAVREYWQKYDLNGSEGSPYPLLVVRPDGAETYVLARHAMSSWDDEFGYELVESDKDLDFGTKDEQLAKLVAEAVNDARSRLHSMLAQRNFIGDRVGKSESTGFASSKRPGLTASGPNGGFVSNSGWEKSVESSAEFGDAANQPPDRRSGMQNEIESNRENRPRSALDQYSDFGSDSMASSNNRKRQQGSTSAAAGNGGDQSSTSNVQCPYQNTNLAKKRGKNWALPTQTPGATGYVRPIRLVCGPSELEIRSALGVEKTIGIGSDVVDAIDPLVNEIWRQIESWGVSGNRSYWKPELRISVLPGGELNFEKLTGLLYNSGVTVKEAAQ